jgi:hypothetical protein
MLIQMTYLRGALVVDTVRASLVSSDVSWSCEVTSSGERDTCRCRTAWTFLGDNVTSGTATVREGNDDVRG